MNPNELIAKMIAHHETWAAEVADIDSEESKFHDDAAAALRTLAQQGDKTGVPEGYRIEVQHGDEPWITTAYTVVASDHRRWSPAPGEVAYGLIVSMLAAPKPDHVADASKMLTQHAAPAVDVLRIPRPSSLDPIIVYFEDSAPGQGRITIACYGDAWTGAWGAMGKRTVRQFVAGTDPDYLADSLLELRKASNHFRGYTTRVAAAVIAALAPQAKAKEGEG